jgi:hypothetical protein
MTGLIVGSLSTLAPISAVTLATHQPHYAFFGPTTIADGERSDDLGGVLERPSGQAGGNSTPAVSNELASSPVDCRNRQPDSRGEA